LPRVSFGHLSGGNGRAEISHAIRFFVMADTASLSGVLIVTTARIEASGEKTMFGFEVIGLGFLVLLFTAVQYACLLTSVSTV
jgi:hypothetical protein